MNSGASLNHPPRARAAFRVGVVGHRPNRLGKADVPALEMLLGKILEQVKSSVLEFCSTHCGVYAPEPPRLRAVSPLAEGTDRMFAEQAFARGYELLCPMPFAQEEFEKDFSPGLEPDSLNRFRELLSRAENEKRLRKFELDGERTANGEAYGAAGRVVLNQSDLLVVVWDGKPAAGAGGTVETLHEALAYRVPVIWIDAEAPHTWQMLDSAADLACLVRSQRCQPRQPSGTLAGTLKDVVTRVLSPPKPPTDAGHGSHKQRPDLREAFFSERKPRCKLAVLWKLFRDAIGSTKFLFPSCRVPDFEQAVMADWPDDEPGSGGWVNHRLRPHYAWADKLGDFYGDRYRSAFVACYLLGAVAVLFALLPVASGWEDTRAGFACLLGEAIAVALIIATVIFAKRGRWHERWMEYRLVAELVRQVRFLIPLGGGRPFGRLPGHLGGYSPFDDWTYWHVRALDRVVGLPAAKMTPEYVRDAVEYTRKVLASQIKYHSTNSGRCERIDHRLHWAGIGLFVLTAFAIAGHFACDWLHHDMGGEFHHRVASVLTSLCGFLPALGAALAAINNQGEFARLAKRSRAMLEHLQRLDREAERLLEPGATPTSRQAASVALRTAQLMVDEVLDWRVVFADRPAELPA